MAWNVSTSGEAQLGIFLPGRCQRLANLAQRVYIAHYEGRYRGSLRWHLVCCYVKPYYGQGLARARCVLYVSMITRYSLYLVLLLAINRTAMCPLCMRVLIYPRDIPKVARERILEDVLGLRVRRVLLLRELLGDVCRSLSTC